MWSLGFGLLAVAQVFIVGMGAGWSFNASKALPIALGVLFVAMGNITPRLRPNWFLGIRTPWTLSSDAVWRRTHRLGGFAMVIGGIVLIIVGLQPSSALRPVGVVLGVLVIGGVPTVFSYLDWRRGGRPNAPAGGS